MALTLRVSLKGSVEESPEDYLSMSLHTLYPDDVAVNHGDEEHPILYSSPKLPKPLELELCNPRNDHHRLFSHFLWNSSLLMAEFVERDSVDGDPDDPVGSTELGAGLSFDTRGLDILELGAGAALPSIMAGLLGAKKLVVTDYPAEAAMETLRGNIMRNITPSLSPPGASTTSEDNILVAGHIWGETTPSSATDPSDPLLHPSHHHAFDRVFVCDCLWMPWQHANLRRSIDHFLKQGAGARCWVISGFHTGREAIGGFFREDVLRESGLEVERMWERDCDGLERAWTWEGDEEPSLKKRWLVVAVLKRVVGGGEESQDD